MQDDWWKHAIIYGADVERFYDSNSDGVGDFPGLSAKLPYLSELGVNCIWLLPFFPSPNRDNGYDIADYYRVDEKYGGLAEFMDFVRNAGELGIRIIVDLVAHHTSDQHPWFQAARQKENSGFRDYYVWVAQPDRPAPGQDSMFPGQENSIWTFDTAARAYYYHRFYTFQPTLNHRNPCVLEEIQRVADFWLSFGIAGFRIDAASHLVEDPLDPEGIGDPSHMILRQLYTHITQRQPDALLMGEVDEDEDELATFFDGEQLNVMFNFFLNNYLMSSLACETADPLHEALSRLPPAPENGQWANFLRNLDEADLERLSDEERSRVQDIFASREDMRIFGRGIRRRLAPMLNDDARLKMAYSLLFALPGIPLICYGDEIGMGDDLKMEGRDAMRSPMQWDDTRNGGFSDAAKSRLVQPVIDKGAFGTARVNVAAQNGADGSLLEHIRKLTGIRHKHRHVGQQDYRILHTDQKAVFALAWRTHEEDVVTLHNVAAKPVLATIEMSGMGTADKPQPLLGKATDAVERNQLSLTLGAYDFRWLRWPRELPR